jgi:predicted transcriptional regulator
MTNAAIPGGELELALLTELWAAERGRTAREIFESVGEPRGIVYTTVAKVLDRLVHKQLISRRKVGRAFVYSALSTRAETQRAMARSFLTTLTGDAPVPAMAALVGAIEDLSPDLLDALERELASRQEKGSDES